CILGGHGTVSIELHAEISSHWSPHNDSERHRATSRSIPLNLTLGAHEN
ncbi:MAG: hypothetical protein ACI9XZ_004424, partial [Alphaproteobacteria bacterium]